LCEGCNTEKGITAFLEPMQFMILHNGPKTRLRCQHCQCPPCNGCGLRPEEPPHCDVKSYYCAVCKGTKKKKICIKCGLAKTLDEYPTEARATVRDTGHIMNSKHMCSVCAPLKESMTCTVCGVKCHSHELYKDDGTDGYRWRGRSGKRTQYWCLKCAFPTCSCCGVQSKVAVERDQATFVNLHTHEWYLYF
jgi:hypothetical protein